MDNEGLIQLLEHLSNDKLEQGILIKVIIDILIDKDVISLDEFTEYVDGVSVEVNEDIKEITKSMDVIEKLNKTWTGGGGVA